MLTLVLKVSFIFFCFVFSFCVQNCVSHFSLRRLLYTTTSTYLWYANNAVMIHTHFHEKNLLELQLYDVVCYVLLPAVGRRNQEWIKKKIDQWSVGFPNDKDDQKNSRKNKQNKLIIHLYGIQQTGMENIKLLLLLNYTYPFVLNFGI